MPGRRMPGLLLVWMVLGCENGSGETGATTAAATPRTASAPAPTAAATPTASAARARYSGGWQGRYRAAPTQVALPRGVDEAMWSKDDGGAAAGVGEIKLDIDAEGQVRGKATGALGAMTLRGVFEGGSLRVGMTPEDPSSEGAMTGILVGKSDGDAIVALLRASNRDATVVRSSEVRFERR